MSRFKIRFSRNNAASVHDAIMAALSFVLANYLRLGSHLWYTVEDTIGYNTAIFTLICVCMFIFMRLYRGLWRYASMQDMIALVKAVSLSVLIFAVVMFVINRLEGVPRSVLVINWMLLLFMLGGPRFLYRAWRDRSLSLRPHALAGRAKVPVMLIGAGDQAEQFIRDMQRDPFAPYEVVALVDDDPKQKGRTIHRIRIYGRSNQLASIIRKIESRGGKRPQKFIVTDSTASGESIRQLLEVADGLGIPLARLPRLSEFKPGFGDHLQIKPIAVEDLLGRAQNVLDRDAMRRFVTGKKVLVTGAGGTIGGELSRQLASYAPSQLVLLELSEFNLYQIEREIHETYPAVPLKFLLGDVRDGEHLNAVFDRYKPDMVFHAAAVKHVPISEFNIEEAVLTNVVGTRNVAEACRKHKASVMVMISTDKAVNPTNVMGASKRLAESFCQALGEAEKAKDDTKFITVRFGNVLGSTGSVVPLFQEQLAKGGPLTVTHPDMTRYFMTVREAVELVLQAAIFGAEMKDRQECIFVLDMGQPVKILDLATQMIRLAGLRPNEDIKIVFIGLRPGEKLYEELFHYSENTSKTGHEHIFLAAPRGADLRALLAGIDKLKAACRERRVQDALAILKSLVPEFNHETRHSFV